MLRLKRKIVKKDNVEIMGQNQEFQGIILFLIHQSDTPNTNYAEPDLCALHLDGIADGSKSESQIENLADHFPALDTSAFDLILLTSPKYQMQTYKTRSQNVPYF